MKALLHNDSITKIKSVKKASVCRDPEAEIKKKKKKQVVRAYQNLNAGNVIWYQRGKLAIELAKVNFCVY